MTHKISTLRDVASRRVEVNLTRGQELAYLGWMVLCCGASWCDAVCCGAVLWYDILQVGRTGTFRGEEVDALPPSLALGRHHSTARPYV